MGVETVLLRVLSVRSQNTYGAIFRAEEIDLDGVICDPARQIVVRTLKRDLACDVKVGQWWSVTG